MRIAKASSATVRPVLLCLLSLAVIALGASPAQGHAGHRGIRVLEGSRPWSGTILSPRALHLETTASSCTGLRPPQITKVRVREFAKRVIITVVVRHEVANSC